MKRFSQIFLQIFTHYLKNALFYSLMNLSMNSLIIIYFSFVTDRQTHCGFMSLLIMLIQIHEIINEFTNEFIELNLLIFCDRQTLWLLESRGGWLPKNRPLRDKYLYFLRKFWILMQRISDLIETLNIWPHQKYPPQCQSLHCKVCQGKFLVCFW